MSKRREQFLKSWEEHGVRDAARKALQRPPEGVAAVRNVSYGEERKQQEALLDVFFPEELKKSGIHLPVILDVHGGGWVYGSKELNEYYCMELAKLGFIVFDINYRLAPETNLKGQVQDVAQALNWIFEHAELYQGNPEQVFVTGDSAGAQLALLTCAALSKTDYREIYELEEPKGKVRALGLVCPVTCLHEMSVSQDEMQQEWMEILYGAQEEKRCCKEAGSFWRYSDPEDYLRDCRIPLLYLLTLPEDSRYYWQSKRLHTLLEKYQIPHRYREWISDGREELGHVFNVLNPQYEESRKANQEMIRFFLEEGRKRN